MKKLFAFNLAEILITMSIIGVVAALVIPPLFGTFEDRMNSVQMKKTYGEIDAAISRYMALKKTDNLSSVSDNAELNNFVNNFFNIAVDCGTASVPNTEADAVCFAKNYRNIKGMPTPISRKATCSKVVMLKSDVSLCIDLPEEDDNFALRFEIDITGKNLPNISGKDLFTVFVYPSGELYDPRFDIEGECKLSEYDAKTGSGLLGKLISTGWNLDYSGCD